TGLLGPGEKGPVTPVKGGFVGDEVAENGPLDPKAYEDPVTHEWVIPETEQNWIEQYAEKDILPQLATKPDVDAQGVSHGLRIMSSIEANAPALGPSHGINQGDIIRSINGVAVTSKEDILNYLRGDGKGL